MNPTEIIGIVVFILVAWLAPGPRVTGTVFFKPAVILGTGIIVAAFIVMS